TAGAQTVSLRLEIAGLRRHQRRELAAVGLDVEQWRLVEAIEPAHQHGVALDADEFDDRGRDRVRPHRRAQGEGATRVPVVLRALQHEVAARPMQPVDHLKIGIEIDALDRGHIRLKDFKPAYWAVETALSRRCQSRGPGRTDASDENKTGVLR